MRVKKPRYLATTVCRLQAPPARFIHMHDHIDRASRIRASRSAKAIVFPEGTNNGVSKLMAECSGKIANNNKGMHARQDNRLA